MYLYDDDCGWFVIFVVNNFRIAILAWSSNQAKFKTINTILQKELNQLQLEVNAKRKVIAILFKLKSRRAILLSYLKEISRLKTSGLWLTSMDFDLKKQLIMLSGKTYTQKIGLDFVKKLNESGVFKGYHFRVSQVNRDKNIFNFELRAQEVSG